MARDAIVLFQEEFTAEKGSYIGLYASVGEWRGEDLLNSYEAGDDDSNPI